MTIVEAIQALRPGAQWSLRGDEYEGLEWLDQLQAKPTEQEIAALLPKPTVSKIAAERERRLALGFDYNFGDARGAHRIGTKPADMVGWSEVSTYAGALLDSGDTTTTIAIVTDTGPCDVTAPEWRAIEIAAASFRQPIWAQSFVLMATLPTDYTNNAHWS